MIRDTDHYDFFFFLGDYLVCLSSFFFPLVRFCFSARYSFFPHPPVFSPHPPVFSQHTCFFPTSTCFSPTHLFFPHIHLFFPTPTCFFPHTHLLNLYHYCAVIIVYWDRRNVRRWIQASSSTRWYVHRASHFQADNSYTESHISKQTIRTQTVTFQIFYYNITSVGWNDILSREWYQGEDKAKLFVAVARTVHSTLCHG